MKHFLLIAMLIAMLIASVSFAASASFARTTSVTGHGNDMGFCSYSQGFYCLSNVKAGSEREATRQADWSCTSQRGRSNPYSAYCTSFCNPNSLNPGDENVMVRCSSDCRMPCEIND